jgi:hypothetical protein
LVFAADAASVAASGLAWPPPAQRRPRASSFSPTAAVNVTGTTRTSCRRQLSGLYTTERTRCGGPWHSIDDVELATLGWVDWCETAGPT